MKHLNKRRLSTFLFLLKKRLFTCVTKASKRKKKYTNNADTAYNNNNNNNNNQVELQQNVQPRDLGNPVASSEIEIATCRICLECEVNEDDRLISPCMCKGTLQFVHRSCLDCWRSVKAGFDFSHCTTCKAQYHLRVLNKTSWRATKFRLFVTRDLFLVFLFLQTVIGMMGGLAYLADTHGSLLNHSWFRILSTNPILFYYCVGVLTIFVLLYLLGLRRAILKCYYNYNDLWMKVMHNGACFYWLPESVDVCLRVLIVLAIILTFAGILYGYLTTTRAIRGIWRRHSHILIIDYTQKYVVEDLKGCYSPAKLDPEEMERLKMLKLW